MHRTIWKSIFTSLVLTSLFAFSYAAADHHGGDHGKSEAAGEHGDHEHGEGAKAEGHGDGEGGHGFFLLETNPGAAIWNLVIFAALFFVLSTFAWPQILEGLRARESKISDDLANAERSNSEAKALLSEYEAKLSDAHGQVQAMLAEARKDADAAKQQILDQAKAEANRERDRAVSEIESAKGAAVSEIADQSSKIALQLARQVVGRELNEGDHAELIRQSLQNLPSEN